MGLKCGPKYTKAEYYQLQKALPLPSIKCSEIARKLEEMYPALSPAYIFIQLGKKMRESKEIREELQEYFKEPEQDRKRQDQKRRRIVKAFS